MAKKFIFSVANKPHFTEHQFLTGAQIKALANVPLEYELYLTAPHLRDELIQDDTVVNFARPGIEKFEVRERKNTVGIIVNGTKVSYDKPTISYEELGIIVYGGSISQNRGYTVAYKDGPDQNPRGIMSKGSIVFVKHNMIFDVTRTHLS